MSRTPPNANQIVIRSEDDAWRALEAALGDDTGKDSPVKSIKFSGWPNLHIYLDVERSTLKATEMVALVEFQQALWRSFALVKCGEANIALLTDEERSALELNFVISGGSLDIAAKAYEVLEPYLPEVIKKMEGKHVAVCVVGVALIFFGGDVWKAHLQTRLEEHKATQAHSERMEELSGRRFVSEQETKRMRMLDEAYKQVLVLRDAKEQADEARIAVLKSMPPEANTKLQGIAIGGSAANELARNVPHVGKKVTLEGRFAIERVDARNPAGFRVALRDLRFGTKFTALLDKDAKGLQDIVERAFFDKVPFKAVIETFRKNGKIHDATIQSAERLPDGWKTTVKVAKIL